MDLTIPLMFLAYPLAAILVYFSCFKGPPIFDDWVVMEEPGRIEWKWDYWRWVHRPLTLLSFWLNSRWPATSRSLHVFNALLHSINGMIVAKIAESLMPVEQAFVAGLLFVVHPWATNAVAYITGRASLLAATFGFLAIWALLTGYWPLALLALWGSVLSKDEGAGFAPILAGIALLQGHWAFLVTATFLGVTFLVRNRRHFRQLFEHGGSVEADIDGLPVAHPQPQHAITVIVETIIRWPQWALGLGLSPYHGSGVPVPRLQRVCIAVALGTTFGIGLANHPIPFLLLVLGPWTAYIFCRVTDQIAEYRSYSSLSSISILAALYIQDATAITVILIFAGIATGIGASAWKSDLAMWTKAARCASGDSSRAHGWVGAVYRLAGNYWAAELALRHALTINPKLGSAYNNLSWILWENAKKCREDDPKRAEILWKEAISLMEQSTIRCPKYAPSWQDLGKMLDIAGQREKADALYRQALVISPVMSYSNNRLGVSAFMKKDIVEAEERIDTAYRQQPQHFEFMYNRACIFRQHGDLDSAQRLFEQLPQPLPITTAMLPLEFAGVKGTA